MTSAPLNGTQIVLIIGESSQTVVEQLRNRPNTGPVGMAHLKAAREFLETSPLVKNLAVIVLQGWVPADHNEGNVRTVSLIRDIRDRGIYCPIIVTSHDTALLSRMVQADSTGLTTICQNRRSITGSVIRLLTVAKFRASVMQAKRAPGTQTSYLIPVEATNEEVAALATALELAHNIVRRSGNHLIVYNDAHS